MCRWVSSPFLRTDVQQGSPWTPTQVSLYGSLKVRQSPPNRHRTYLSASWLSVLSVLKAVEDTPYPQLSSKAITGG